MPRSSIVRQGARFFSACGLTHAQAAVVSHPNITRALKALCSIPSQYHPLAFQSDGAGSVFDPYCMLPFYAFLKTFLQRGFTLTHAQITGPMGMDKRGHIKHLVFSELKSQWKEQYRKAPDEKDVDSLHQEFNVHLKAEIPRFAVPVPQVNVAADFLQQMKIPAALTSGYSRETIDRFLSLTPGLPTFAVSTTADEVVGSRMEMIIKNMLKLKLHSSLLSRVCFATDSRHDVETVMKSKYPFKPWVIGLAGFSTHVGITSENELSTLTLGQLAKKRGHAEAELLKGGTHAVINDLSELPLIWVAISEALSQGKMPSTCKSLLLPQPSETSFNNYNPGNFLA